MNYKPPFIPEARAKRESFQERVARARKAREDAAERVARRYDEMLICRGRTSRVSATSNRNRVCSQCNLESPHNPGSDVCRDCE